MWPGHTQLAAWNESSEPPSRSAGSCWWHCTMMSASHATTTRAWQVNKNRRHQFLRWYVDGCLACSHVAFQALAWSSACKLWTLIHPFAEKIGWLCLSFFSYGEWPEKNQVHGTVYANMCWTGVPHSYWILWEVVQPLNCSHAFLYRIAMSTSISPNMR